MRVIAGVARRILLAAPRGLSTRPTSDRAKEGLFNMLANRLPGARFLDLFCGSGAMGIEALSRGAHEAVFVDNAKSALDAVQENLTKTRLTDNAHVLGKSVQKAIEQLAQVNRQFDMIFLDPPYDLNGTRHMVQTLESLAASSLLADGGVIVAETDAKIAPDAVPPFVCAGTRSYGRTCFLFYERGVS